MSNTKSPAALRDEAAASGTEPERRGDVASLVGEYERSIDGNGRLTLPSKFAGLFGVEAYLSDDRQGCARLWLAPKFEQRLADLREAVDRGEAQPSQIRSYSQSSRLINIDKQGRLTIDEQARLEAGLTLGGNVILLGYVDSVEMWRPSRRAVIKRETDDDQPRRIWGDEDDE